MRLIGLVATTVLLAAASSISEAAPSTGCQLQQLAEYKITMVGNEPLIDVSINGQPARFMVDMGSAATIISRPAAQALGLTLRRMNGVDFYGVGGSDIADRTNIRELKLGDATVHNVDLIVTGRALDPRHYVGLLGQDFLSQADVEFDFADGAMRLFKPQGCKGDQVVYWGKAYSMAPIAASQSSGVLDVDVQLNGHTIEAEVDTGAYTSVVTTSAAALAGVTPNTEGVKAAGTSGGLGSERVPTSVAVFSTFTIGDETIRNAKLRIADLYRADQYLPGKSRLATRVTGFSDMLLGADFVKAHRIYVARSQGKIYFSYNGGPIFQVIAPRVERPQGPPETPPAGAPPVPPKVAANP